MQKLRYPALLVALGLVLVTFAGCGGGEEYDSAKASVATAIESPVDALKEKGAELGKEASHAAIEAFLVKADSMDGTEDKVVSKCPGCALAMPGDAEHAMDAHGYELHFCSTDCKERFEENADKALMALAIPQD